MGCMSRESDCSIISTKHKFAFVRVLDFRKIRARSLQNVFVHLWLLPYYVSGPGWTVQPDSGLEISDPI